MQDRRLAGGDGALESRRELRGVLDRLAMAAEGARIGGEIGVLQRRGADAARIFALLMHADRAIHAIVDDDDDDGEVVLHGGGEFLAVPQGTGLTREGGDHAATLEAL